ncbi:hypothetical protein ES332_D11G391600v1 [Gossypium tomentosum]|uniref:K-box domain-containing protein n=1 Tax=Gossypium tomentosum TaxID=34277 RepID=A0A5D2IYM2_GOSTO|nr:hypothetical protein ES332_D11G391600v1 [Gossypium tomentosum]
MQRLGLLFFQAPARSINGPALAWNTLFRDTTKESKKIILKNTLLMSNKLRRLNGKELDDLSFKELKQLEDQLNEGIASVERQKEQILMEQLKRSRLQEQKTIMENEDLRKQVEELRQKGSSNILELNPLLERRLDHSPNNSKADDNNSASDDDNHLSDTSLHLGLTSNIGRKRKATEIEPTTNDSGSQVASE